MDNDDVLVLKLAASNFDTKTASYKYLLLGGSSKPSPLIFIHRYLLGISKRRGGGILLFDH